MTASSRDRLIELLRTYSFKEGDFVLASGKRSSFYVDVRRTALLAEGGALLGELLLDRIDELGWRVDAAGGMTLGADPLTTAMAVEAFRRGRAWSSFLVRKEPKAHGTGSQVELAGDLEPGARVVILDDTVTTGSSTLRSVQVMQAAGFDVVGALCAVDRDEGGFDTLASVKIPFASLFTIEDLRG